MSGVSKKKKTPTAVIEMCVCGVIHLFRQAAQEIDTWYTAPSALAIYIYIWN